MTEANTLDDLLQLAITAETELRDLYREFARKFSHQKEIAAFWEDLSRDETFHADGLENIRKDLDTARSNLLAEALIYLDAQRALRLIKRTRRDAVKTLDDAYEIAHEIENSEVNTVFQFLLNQHTTTEKTKELLSYELTKHLEKLKGFTGTFGDREYRMAIEAKIPDGD